MGWSQVFSTGFFFFGKRPKKKLQSNHNLRWMTLYFKSTFIFPLNDAEKRGQHTHTFSIATKAICHENWLIFATPNLHLRETIPFPVATVSWEKQLAVQLLVSGRNNSPRGQTKNTESLELASSLDLFFSLHQKKTHVQNISTSSWWFRQVAFHKNLRNPQGYC